jgi:hypothetical protein
MLKGIKMAVFFVYTARDITDYTVIEPALKKGLKKLTGEIRSIPNQSEK